MMLIPAKTFDGALWVSADDVQKLQEENAALRAEVDRQRDELMTQGRQWLEDRAELASMTLERQMRLMAEQSNVKLQAELAALKAGDVVMVPREPTDTMLYMMCRAINTKEERIDSYKEMIAAAPGVATTEDSSAHNANVCGLPHGKEDK